MRSTAILAVLAALTLWGCDDTVAGGNTNTNTNTTVTDVDADGSPADVDCDDNDAARFPGNPEICDKKDNNCNDVADEGLSCETKPDTGTETADGGVDGGGKPDTGPEGCNGVPVGQTRPCGAPGSTCKQACEDKAGTLTWSECKTGSGQVPETDNDINNCGQCGNVCPTPLHSAAQCKKGACQRGPCEAGYFDFDREQTFGCEVQCNGKQCTNGTQNWTLTAEPLPEKGLVFQTFASGGSYGDKIQTNASYTNMGTLGEPTPPGVNGATEMSNATHKNVGGFGAALRK